MARHRSLIPWLLIAVAVLIAYGSLYPFNFKPDVLEGGVFRALRQLSWARAGRGDRISNVLLYLPLGFCLFLWLDTRFRRGVAMPLAALVGTLFSLVIEVAQVYVSIRVPSLTDLALNALGTALGAGGGLAWRGLSSLMHLPARADTPTRDPGAALLILLWLIWRFAPFVPHFDLAKLKAALRPLFNPSFEPVAVFVYLTCWLVVYQALSTLVSRPRRLEALLLVIAAVLVGRLLVANQAFVPAELIALLLLLPLVVLMHRLTPQPRRAALVLAVTAVLLIDGLAPFNFSAATARFDLWPFMVWFDAGPMATLRSIDWAALLGKLFTYGALLWVVKEWGTSIRFAVGVMVALVAVVEILQLWLPGRSASITDPLLALAIGLLFRYVYQRAQPRLFARRAILRRARNR